MKRDICTVLKHTPSVLMGVFVFVLVLSLVALVPSRESLSAVIFNSEVASSTKAVFFFALYGSLLSNQSLLSGMIAFVTALLAGVNTALIFYYLKVVRTGRVSVRVSFTSIGGLVAGLFGIGCAACGSLLLTAILAGVGSTALLLLPLKGAEVGFLGIALLFYSTYTLNKEIAKGPVCKV